MSSIVVIVEFFLLYSKLGLNAVPRNTQGVMIDPQESSFHLLCETVECPCSMHHCLISLLYVWYECVRVAIHVVEHITQLDLCSNLLVFSVSVNFVFHTLVQNCFRSGNMSLGNLVFNRNTK